MQFCHIHHHHIASVSTVQFIFGERVLEMAHRRLGSISNVRLRWGWGEVIPHSHSQYRAQTFVWSRHSGSHHLVERFIHKLNAAVISHKQIHSLHQFLMPEFKRKFWHRSETALILLWKWVSMVNVLLSCPVMLWFWLLLCSCVVDCHNITFSLFSDQSSYMLRKSFGSLVSFL